MADFSMQVDEEQKDTKSKKTGKKFSPKMSGKKLMILVVVLLLLASAGGYAYQTRKVNNLKKENARLADPRKASQAEADQLKAEVAERIEVPKETQTIATVVDADKLKNQPFFADAQNGDKVLLFAQAKKAILYRPSTKKIIEVAPINIGNNNSSQTPAPASSTAR